MRIRGAIVLPVLLVACPGRWALDAPPCTIGQPCQFLGDKDGSTTDDGVNCRGVPSDPDGGGGCTCACSSGFDDAGSDADGAAAWGACGTGPPDACNQVENVGTVVTPTCVASSPPVMNGGTIAYGTYVLVSGTAYASSCAGLSLPTGGPTTLVVSAGCIQSIDATGGAQTYEWDSAGSELSEGEVCPGAQTAQLQFTATATTLSELAAFEPGVSIVSVFQKQ